MLNVTQITNKLILTSRKDIENKKDRVINVSINYIVVSKECSQFASGKEIMKQVLAGDVTGHYFGGTCIQPIRRNPILL